ncbi:PQQ-binding-like beta-propeller repeat protein [Rhodopirellula sp. P2]|uniref:PQQ-binding-like beta-propeller repeat protein n=1 Tax=Rhodopirellula sp. P2 TaxID=2127060 RepID=UPI0023678B9F|nr:PQQ-binding-like beta-propeller repeat protein [Rhodopirellula sp. P2]WDQ14615.1 PQQ-like beta-propeller repeat protein [Rhodopirellula sp. P2]
MKTQPLLNPNSSLKTFFAIATLASSLCTPWQAAFGQAVWPAFLGQGSSETFQAEKLPLNWSPGENVRWKQAILGKGQSSPVVWGDTVYVTSIQGEMKETCVVMAIALADGQVKWTRQIESATPVRSNYFQSRSAPTPVVDEKHVVAFFETGNLVGIDRNSGELLWERSLPDETGVFQSDIGLASSLAQHGSNAFVLIDHEGDSYLMAVNKGSGETAWKTERFSRKSYASPAILQIGSKAQIVCSSDGSVDGYSPETGEQLWTFEDIGANTSNTPPAVLENMVLVGASNGMQDARAVEARESNLCLRIDGDGKQFQPEVAWKTTKATTTFASPIAHQGLAYWITTAGVLYCFDLESGELVYRKRAGEQCWVTPVGIGDRIYLFGKGGETTVIAAGPEFNVLAENELWDIDSIPATSSGQFAGPRSGKGGRPDSRKGGGSRPTESANAQPSVTKNAEGEPKPEDSAARKPMDDDAIEAARQRGENQFADPVQYGVAFTQDAILIRTGSELHCIANSEAIPADEEVSP